MEVAFPLASCPFSSSRVCWFFSFFSEHVAFIHYTTLLSQQHPLSRVYCSVHSFIRSNRSAGSLRKLAVCFERIIWSIHYNRTMQLQSITITLLIIVPSVISLPISTGPFTETDVVQMRLAGKDEVGVYHYATTTTQIDNSAKQSISRTLNLKSASPSYRLVPLDNNARKDKHAAFALVPQQEFEREKQAQQQWHSYVGSNSGGLGRWFGREWVKRKESRPEDEEEWEPRKRGLKPRYLME